MAMEAEHAYGGVVWVPERHASVKPTEGLDESVGPLRRERAPATTREADARSLAPAGAPAEGPDGHSEWCVMML